jgi:hypothetical protein
VKKAAVKKAAPARTAARARSQKRR